MSFHEYKKPGIEIHSAVQIGVAASGTPRWQLNTNEGPWVVQTNAYLQHRIADLKNPAIDSASTPTLIGKPGRSVTLIHNRAGKVVAIEYQNRQFR